MGKRSGLFFAILLIANVAAAQSDSQDCASGVVSSVDGTCVSDAQPYNQDYNQPYGNGQTSPQGGGSGVAIDSTGVGSSQLSSQYPGLQPQGMNSRVPTILDQGGLTNRLTPQEILQQAQLQAPTAPTAPTDFQLLVRSSLGETLPIYGDSLFRRVPSTFAPLREVNVTPNYVLGPGDQLVIRIWGQVNSNAQLTVDRSGSIYLPQVGEIHVAGLPFDQVKDHIHDALSRIYRSFELDVEMGQLRSIQVFLVGQARRPGTYTLSSLSTLVTALFATGGPSVQGSLRDIQLRRGGQTVTHFDLYDLLLLGDMSKDAALLPGDVIYIPPVSAQVAIAGDVHVPAIYELKGDTTVDQALRFAGGLSSTASLERASLERLNDHKDRTVLDVSLEGVGLNTPLKAYDVLRVRPISPRFQDTITLRGNVAEPGRFAWHTGMKLSDIIPDSQSLIVRDYWERRNRLGIPGPEFKPEYAYNPDYFPRNSIGFQTGTPQYDSQGVPIPPRPYGLYPNGQGTQTNDQSNANQQNNNNSPNNPNQAYDQNCDYTNNNNQNLQAGGIFGAAAGLSAAQNNRQPCRLNPTDNESSGSHTVAEQEQASNVASPKPPMTVSLSVPEIDWSYAVIERMNQQTLTTSLVPFNPGALILDHDMSQDLALQPGDVVTVFSQADIKVPQAERTKFVRLEGEFKHSGIYSVLPGETLPQLIERAGGFTPGAYIYGSTFTRESTRVLQQVRLDDYLQNLELEIDRATIASAASVGAVDPSATAASRSLVARFRSIRATGRVVLDIPTGATGTSDLPNMALEDGDRFVVPSKPATINVVGAVYDQNSFLFKNSQVVGSYLRLAGGPTKSADGPSSFIIRADGAVVSRRSQSGVFGNTFASMHLSPGDTVVIPEKVPRPSNLRNFINYTQIFSQLALGAAAIAVLQ